MTAPSPCHSMSAGVPELFPRWAAQLLELCGSNGLHFAECFTNARDVLLKSCVNQSLILGIILFKCTYEQSCNDALKFFLYKVKIFS